MTTEEAKAILAVYRPGGADSADPFFRDALDRVAEDPALGKWFADEQAMDATLADKAFPHPPAGLRAELLATLEPRNTFEWNFTRALAFAAAAALLTLLLSLEFLAPRGHTQAALENYRSEMVSFVKLDPALDLETGDQGKIQSMLARNISQVNFPPGLQSLPAVGCRALMFRGYKVGLACFKREGGGLAHLLVVNRAAFGMAPLPDKPVFHEEDGWMTATWADGKNVYLLATKGDRKALEPLLPASGQLL